jgi:hypothetical protein
MKKLWRWFSSKKASPWTLNPSSSSSSSSFSVTWRKCELMFTRSYNICTVLFYLSSLSFHPRNALGVKDITVSWRKHLDETFMKMIFIHKASSSVINAFIFILLFSLSWLKSEKDLLESGSKAFTTFSFTFLRHPSILVFPSWCARAYI